MPFTPCERVRIKKRERKEEKKKICVTGCIRDAFSKTIPFASHSQNFIHVTLELVRIKSFDTRDFVRQKGSLRIKFMYQLERVKEKEEKL